MNILELISQFFLANKISKNNKNLTKSLVIYKSNKYIYKKKKMRKYIISAIFIIIFMILTSCVTKPTINWNNPQEIISRINVEYDGFEKVTKFTGPYFKLDYDSYVFIRAWKFDINNKLSYQIYVKDRYYGDWKYYNTSYDSNGNRMDFTLIHRDVDSCGGSGCHLIEHIGLNVDENYLKKHIKSGIYFKISGKAGEQIFYLPGSYINAFLNITK
ncbi:MAG: hypothetical protein JRE64_17775 [Deltaproteobacteria bacterium]|nr:hypothetical protein [Deltaproteobacteria bacterium]